MAVNCLPLNQIHLAILAEGRPGFTSAIGTIATWRGLNFERGYFRFLNGLWAALRHRRKY
jgi:hypothetical protein